MKCEDVELELSGGELSTEAREHLEGCASCQATAKLLGLAALPPLSETERLVLGGLAASTQKTWRETRRRSGAASRLASLALAAGVGALLASAVLMKLVPQPEPRVETRTVMVTPPEIPVLEASDEINLSDDEVFFDVGWPSPTEGDL